MNFNIKAWLAALIVVCTATTHASAAESGMREIKTGDDSRAWNGVGRVELGNGGFCTGALISERLVLTAAHCLFDKQSGQPVQPQDLQFLAGWRDGRAAAHRSIRRVMPHPSFDPGAEMLDEIRHDLGLLELDHPIRNGAIGVFEISDRRESGSEVGVVSYAHDRSEHATLQEVCEIIGRERGFLVMSCEADFGSSGAPVFVFENGQPQVVSVVSAKAVLGERRVSLGSVLGNALTELIHLAQGSDGVFRRQSASAQPERSGAGGAKFLRP